MTATAPINEVQLPDMSAKVSNWPETARRTVVSDEDSARDAADLLQGITLLEKEVKATFDPICDSAHKAWKAATGARAKHLQPLEEASSIIRRTIADWKLEEDRKRREEQERIQAQLHREAEERRLAEAAVIRERTGSEEAAMEVLEAPLPVQRYVPPAAPSMKGTGISVRKVLKGKVVNKAKFLAHVVQRPELLELVDVNQGALNKLVGALGARANFPGIEVYEEATTAVRTARAS